MRYRGVLSFLCVLLFFCAVGCDSQPQGEGKDEVRAEATQDGGVERDEQAADDRQEAQVEKTIEAVAEGLPELASEGLPDGASESPLESASERTPEAVPEQTPEAAPEQTPEATPEMTPEMPAPQSVALYARQLNQQSGNILLSNGIPFAQGVLQSEAGLLLLAGTQEIPLFVKVLARWPDQSIRAILLQANRPSTSLPQTLTLVLNGQPTQPRATEVPVTWTLPQGIAFPDKAYLSASMIAGPLLPTGADARFQRYDQQAETNYNLLKGDADWGADARLDGYYSTTLTWYLLFLRTGDEEKFSWARREAVHYRDDQIIQSGANAGRMNNRTEPRYLYLRAMELDYLLTGDPKTLQVAGLMADYLHDLHPLTWYHYKRTDTRFWTERRAGFALLGLLVYGRWTGQARYLQRAKDILDQILATQAEWPDGGFFHNLYAHDTAECDIQTAYGGSPFMTGLLFEGLLLAHHWLGDPRILPAMRKAVDWLWTGWRQNGFLYLIGCGNRYTTSAPDLNLLLAHGFAFVYWADGKKAQDLQRANLVFNEGVQNAFLRARKQYNQNYRSSAATLWYLTQ